MTNVEALAVVAVIAGFLFALVWIARRARRGGTAGPALAGAMAAYNEAWHPIAYEMHVEMQAEADRIATSESPEDL